MLFRFASATIVTTWILQSLTVSVLSAANTTFQTQNVATVSGPVDTESALSPSALLNQALELAQQGDLAGGIAKASDAKNLAQQSGQFSGMLVVEYLNTVKELVKLSQPEQLGVLKVEISKIVDQFISNLDFDGRGNPQISYFFMTSVKQLGDAFLEHDASFFVRLQMQQGSIARNLKTNLNYPADGRAFLGDALASMAAAFALKEDLPAANLAMSEACELGFCDFEKLEKMAPLKQIKDSATFETHINQLRDRYLASLKDWSANELGRFQGFRFNFHVDSVKGGSLSSRNQNGKIMVIDLWATWCPPCRESLPHFDRLHKDYRNSGVRVIGISMDSPDDPSQSLDKVREFLSQNELVFPCGMGTNDLKNQLPAEMKLPTTLYVDRSGNVRYMTNGYQDYAKVAAITETLLNEKLPVTTESELVQPNQ